MSAFYRSLILRNIGFLILLTGIVLCQYFFDIHKPRQSNFPLIILPASVLKRIDLGLHSATAALLWINIIQKIGGFNNLYTRFTDDTRIINNVDPKFSYPYAFATLIAPSISPAKINDVIEIGKRGVRDAAPDWRIPYYLGVTYHMALKDRANATKYLDIAAHTPGAPGNIKYVAANFGALNNAREQTKQIWIALYENSNDELVRERAKAYIVHIEILNILDQAIRAYKNQKGKSPQKIEDLVRAKLIKQVPIDPFGFIYTIDDKGKLHVGQ